MSSFFKAPSFEQEPNDMSDSPANLFQRLEGFANRVKMQEGK